jgi:predicted Zn-dependent protease
VSAALAHELGHLLADGHLRSVVGLNGGELDCESRADAIGLRLLVAAHLGPEAMASMLEKVGAAPGMSPASQKSLGHRIEILRGLLASQR